jgi:hypothetical protein
MGSIKAFGKSTSDRFARWAGEQTMRSINDKLTSLLGATDPGNHNISTPAAAFGLSEPIIFDDIYFDSTCVKADIHFPIDWVLLRDAARTLMKATNLSTHTACLRSPRSIPIVNVDDLSFMAAVV